jgi:hypothetical protein
MRFWSSKWAVVLSLWMAVLCVGLAYRVALFRGSRRAQERLVNGAVGVNDPSPGPGQAARDWRFDLIVGGAVGVFTWLLSVVLLFRGAWKGRREAAGQGGGSRDGPGGEAGGPTDRAGA